MANFYDVALIFTNYTIFMVQIIVHNFLFSLAESPSPIGSGGDIETVELMKPEQGGLGLLIFETDDQPGVFIQEVVQNKAAYLDGRIRPGDRILAINGEKIYNAGQNYVVRLLQV
jgi:S1-C subfamily serine protease